MAYASVTYTSASGTTFALTNSNGDPIPYIRQSDIKVYVNTVLQTLTTDYTFNTAGTAIVLNSAVSGATVLLQRITDIADPTVVYTAGSTLTAQDLNNADNQIRYGLQEFQDSVDAGGGVPDGDKGDISVGGNGTIWTVDNGAVTEAKIASGAVTETKIGTGAVTSTKIANDTIVNADINSAAAIAYSKLNLTGSVVDADISASAEIAVSKLADGTARQLLQTDAAGTGVEWASNIDIPGTLDVTGNTTLDGDLTIGGSFNVTSLNGGPLAGTRNRIINGNFDIWQRGTSTGSWVAPITNYYWPDRWVFNSTGTGGNGSVSQQAFTPGQTDVPGEPTFFMRWQITSAASGQTAGSCYVEQRIEDVRTLAGQTATISFYAKGTGTLPNIYLTQTFGSGGSTQVLYTLATNVALSANWTKYTYTVNVGSISGRTIGTNHYVGLTFMVPINTTYTFDLAQVQVEAGTVATPFERRSYGQELALCQRYYGRSGGTNTHAFSYDGTLWLGDVPFKVSMRAIPTVTLTGAFAGSVGAADTEKFYFLRAASETFAASWAASAEL